MNGRARAALPLLALAVTACVHASARPRDVPPSFPFPADTLRTQIVAAGVIHRFVYAPSGPWAINVLQVDLDRCNAPRAVKGMAGAIGREKTSVLLSHLNDSVPVVGGVNADFFSLTAPAGVPAGLLVIGGRLVNAPGVQPAIAVDSSGTLRIARFRVVRPLAPFFPREAVGGRPLLLRDSVIVADVDTTGQAGFATGRHPRTAAGITRNGKRLILVTVDGRQKPYSDGMTLRELANLMLALGARDALNLDGGGSTTMVYADPDSGGKLRVANRPSDKEGERPVGDALAIVRGCSR